MEPQEKLLETLELHKIGFEHEGAGGQPCPFYGRLCAAVMRDVERGGAAWDWLEPHASADFDQAYVLRLLGALHRMALAGDSSDLVARFPSTGGDGDADATYRILEGLLADPPPLLADMMTRPPQTNEVGRSIALMSGLLVLADRLRLPMALREIGSSAGLNLRLDTYWYEEGPTGWGNPASKVRFSDMWPGKPPPFGADLTIADRRGCDRDPIDVSDPEGALTLLSYVWPEPEWRFQLASNAIEQARDVPVMIDKEDAEIWLPRVLGEEEDGIATVVLHSVMWRYLGEDGRAAATQAIEEAGARATRAAPLAWLRLEPHPETFFPGELRLRVWDGEDHGDELLAHSGFHGGPLSDWSG